MAVRNLKPTLHAAGRVSLLAAMVLSGSTASARQDTNTIFCLDTIVINAGEASIPTLKDWKVSGAELLFVTVSGDRSIAIDLADSQMKVLTADMRFLTDRTTVLQAARAAIRNHAGVTGIETIARRVPPEVANAMPERVPRCREESWWVDCLSASVPVDHELGVWAAQAATSPLLWERAEAADALQYFPSDENIVRLRQLLDDPAVVVIKNDGVEERLYVVRGRAYESLRALGVKVPEPVLRQAVNRRTPQ